MAYTGNEDDDTASDLEPVGPADDEETQHEEAEQAEEDPA